MQELMGKHIEIASFSEDYHNTYGLEHDEATIGLM